MSDYIERDELLELYTPDPDCEGCSVPYPIVRQNILDMPAADVAPVVYCKDCIHSISYVDKSGAIAYVVCNLDEDSDEIELRTPMDYCSYGEREGANT